MKLGEELDEFVFVLEENVLDRFCLVWVCYKHLEDMEGLKLDVATTITEHGHHELEVLRVADVSCHGCEVVPVQ